MCIIYFGENKLNLYKLLFIFSWMLSPSEVGVLCPIYTLLSFFNLKKKEKTLETVYLAFRKKWRKKM